MSRKSKKSGLPPDSLVHVSNLTYCQDSVITKIVYTEEAIEEKTLSFDQVPVLREIFSQKDKTSWVSVVGLSNISLVEEIGKSLELHPLVLEDILNATQRAKREDYQDYTFIVLRLVDYNPEKNEIESEQVSLLVGDNWVISFQERSLDIFKVVRERLRAGKGKLRKEKADYLCYNLIDSIVDNYFVDLEALGEEHEKLEQEVVKLSAPLSTTTLNKIYKIKRNILSLRRAVWPLRELLGALHREENPRIRSSTRLYFRDVYDHVVEIIDIVETLRETSGSLIELYLSAVNHRVNEVSKVLTMIATIFLPLTFVTSIYGMNFQHMPELQQVYGYPAVMIFMLVLAAGMMIAFKRKGWW